MNDMNKIQIPITQEKSALQKIKLFYEHTDDNRVVVDTRNKQIKQPSRNSLSKR